jgi:hypothetical protein
MVRPSIPSCRFRLHSSITSTPPLPPHPCRKRSFWDPEPRALRSQLLGRYEALLFTDLAFAGANDVEQLLWKGCFYRPLEEFRGRAREADKVGLGGGGGTGARWWGGGVPGTEWGGVEAASGAEHMRWVGPFDMCLLAGSPCSTHPPSHTYTHHPGGPQRCGPDGGPEQRGAVLPGGGGGLVPAPGGGAAGGVRRLQGGAGTVPRGASRGGPPGAQRTGGREGGDVGSGWGGMQGV